MRCEGRGVMAGVIPFEASPLRSWPFVLGPQSRQLEKTALAGAIEGATGALAELIHGVTQVPSRRGSSPRVRCASW